jgi:hypothetical protein
MLYFFYWSALVYKIKAREWKKKAGGVAFPSWIIFLSLNAFSMCLK